MEIRILPDADRVASAAAAFIASEARSAIAARGRFVMAVSGGSTPWAMVRELAIEELAWDKVHVVQVDERIAPPGDPERNLTNLCASFGARLASRVQIQAISVEISDPEEAARIYAASLQEITGSPVVLDLVHLGLGSDGHTASLIPNDPVLDVSERDVATTGSYNGRRRITLTYPIINRARQVLWLITGAEKQEMLVRLREGDVSIPAGRVKSVSALVLTDIAAGALLGRG